VMFFEYFGALLEYLQDVYKQVCKEIQKNRMTRTLTSMLLEYQMERTQPLITDK
jgi:hypothetical protein